MSAEQKSWRFDKIAGNFLDYIDFDGQLYGNWTDSNCSFLSGGLDGSGYYCRVGNGVVAGSLLNEIDLSALSDLYVCALLYNEDESATYDCTLQVTIWDGTNELEIRIGSNPSSGGTVYVTGVEVGNWYFVCLPISYWMNEFFSQPSPAVQDITFAGVDDSTFRVEWIGVFKASAFSDDYCIDCRCGTENDVDSGVRDIEADDCYLSTTDSDITIGDVLDYDVDSNNCYLTLYGTLGSGMRLKVTISWEISSSPQTDVVLYATTLPYSWNLATECPSIDKITKIVIENVVNPS